MKSIKLTLRPLTPFGTPLAGDTLFGHLCWALALRRGADGLTALLDGYTDGRPFAVVSDAFPAGRLPRPTLPDAAAGVAEGDPATRKARKRMRWLPAEQAALPLHRWLAVADAAHAGRETVLTQNTINRLTGTTGRAAFAPRQVDRIEFDPGTLLDLYLVLDPERLPEPELLQAIEDIGLGGYGRDASTGLGKFELHACADLPPASASLHAMTLAPCAPDPAQVEAEGSWWLLVTRFGRHGGAAALGGSPFKRPVLLARTGAVLRWREPAARQWHGVGLGGATRPVSAALPATVHQGYAPLVSLRLEVRP